MKQDIYPKISIVLNIILGLAVIYMFVFSGKDKVERYEAEISRLETENQFMMSKYTELENLNSESKDRVIMIDDKLKDVNKSLISVNKELKKIEKNGKKDKVDFVNNLHNDSVAVEFTKYLQRRSR